MLLITRLRKSKYHLIFQVLPVVVFAGCVKITFHFLGWEMIPKDFTAFLPSILTGIIFILGFLLAGVVTDYKESEKIPNELAMSIFILWQEAVFTREMQGCPTAPVMLSKLKLFIPRLKEEFFFKQNNQILFYLNELSEDIIQLGREGAAANYIFRMKIEISNLKKLMNRVTVIKKTEFIPSAVVCIQAFTIIFLTFYCFLIVEPWWGGLLLTSIFTFVILTVLLLIKDMEDPFRYDGSVAVKSDEVSLAVLDQLQEEFETIKN
jgi:hypothetical protein